MFQLCEYTEVFYTQLYEAFQHEFKHLADFIGKQLSP